MADFIEGLLAYVYLSDEIIFALSGKIYFKWCIEIFF